MLQSRENDVNVDKRSVSFLFFFPFSINTTHIVLRKTMSTDKSHRERERERDTYGNTESAGKRTMKVKGKKLEGDP